VFQHTKLLKLKWISDGTRVFVELGNTLDEGFVGCVNISFAPMIGNGITKVDEILPFGSCCLQSFIDAVVGNNVQQPKTMKAVYQSNIKDIVLDYDVDVLKTLITPWGQPPPTGVNPCSFTRRTVMLLNFRIERREPARTAQLVSVT
jgi:hypothetical protein